MFKIGDIVRGRSSSEDFYSGIRIGKVLEILEEKNSLILEILQHEDYLNNNTTIEISNFGDYLEDIDTIIEIDDISNLIFNHKLNNSKVFIDKLGSISETISTIKSNLLNITKEINKVTKDIMQFKKEDNLATKLVEELNLIQADEKCDEININIDEDYINIITKQIYI